MPEMNEPKRPLIEVLEDSIKRALQEANLEDKSVDQKQFLVLQEVYKTLTDLTGGESPSYPASGIFRRIRCHQGEQRTPERRKDFYLERCT